VFNLNPNNVIAGPLKVDDDGLHGMVKRCTSIYLENGAHSVYLVGFQAGGGVGMEVTYFGADTAFTSIRKKVVKRFS
jgi:hypothetical protein